MTWVLVLAVVAAVTNDAVRVVTVADDPFEAHVTAVDSAWSLQLQTPTGPTELAAADLVRYGTPRDPQFGPLLLLVDGGAVPARVKSSDGDQLQIEPRQFGEQSVALEHLAGIVFELPRDLTRRDRLIARVRNGAMETDRVILHNGDEITGTITSLDEESVKLVSDVGDLTIERDQVAALAFDPSLAARPRRDGFRAWVGFDDGTSLLAEQLVVTADRAELTTTSGAAWSGAADKLTWIQPVGGKATYASQLEPASYRHVPFLSLPWQYALDRTVTGTRLRCGGRVYPFGINMHSASRITYELDRSYQRFEAEVGIDDHVGPHGSVVFRVFVDGKERLATPVIRGDSPPVPIAVPLAGARRISLIVDYADRGDELDHADWLDARFIE